MLSITVGPLSLPLRPVALLLSVWLAAWLAGRLAHRAGIDPAPAESLLLRAGGRRGLAARAALAARKRVV